MNADEALSIVQKILGKDSLSDLQSLILQKTWQGYSYSDIVQDNPYNLSYIKETGSQLWQKLSKALGIKVNKRNLQTVLKHYQTQKAQPHTPPAAPSPEPSPGPRLHWDETIDIAKFYGRSTELDDLSEWVITDQCRLLGLFGMGGIGKTALAAKLAHQLSGHFQYSLWRSLRNAPQLSVLLADLLRILADNPTSILPESTPDRLNLLMEHLRQKRCLLILDNAESILQSCETAGQYQPNCEDYADLLRRVGEESHQSCLILTSREKPKEFVILSGDRLPVHAFSLQGLESGAALKVLHTKGLLYGSTTEWQSLIDRYRGNPLALKIIASTIQEVFESNITDFLSQEKIVFGNLADFLLKQFQRLSPLEQDIMYWLAVNREWVSLNELQEDLLYPIDTITLRQAIASLQQRSLIETTSTSTAILPIHLHQPDKPIQKWTQQPMVMEFVTEHLLTQLTQEICTAQPNLLNRYALLKAEASDSLRASQQRILLNGLAQQLQTHYRTLPAIAIQLQKLLSILQQNTEITPSIGYAAGTLLNLLVYLKIDLTGYDFSGLAVWQAYLQGEILQHTNFARADLAKSVFTQSLGNVLSVAFNPVGSLLASGDADGFVRIWQVTNGQAQFTCSGHSGWVWAVAFSPDGRLVASGAADQMIKLWDATTGKCLKTLTGHSHWILAIAFSPDGTKLASCSDDLTIKLWDVSTGQCIQTLEGHTQWILSVAFNSDGTQLATASHDQTIRIWDLEENTCIRILDNRNSTNDPNNWLWGALFAPDDLTVISAGQDGCIRLWSLVTGDCFKVITAHSGWIRGLGLHPDGKTLVTGSSDHLLKTWDLQTGTCLNIFSGHTNWVYGTAIHPSGQIIASGSQDMTIKFWNLAKGDCLKTLQGYVNPVFSVSFAPSQQITTPLLATSSEDQLLRIWDLETQTCLKTFQGHINASLKFIFSSDGQILASGSMDRKIKLWDYQTGQCQHTLSGHTKWVLGLSFSPNSRYLASSCEDSEIKLWQVDTGTCLQTFQGHTNWVWAIAFMPDGETLVSGGDDGTVRFWNIHTGDCTNIWQAHSNWIRAIAISPDGQTLITSSGDQTVKVWDIATGICSRTLEGHSNGIWSVAISLDGQTIASGGDDQIIRLWHLQTGDCIQILNEHKSRVWSLAFHDDGQWLASGSQDSTAKVWDIQTGKCIHTLQAPRPYESMNIENSINISDAQKTTLQILGAQAR